jgi:hypothetical protein
MVEFLETERLMQHRHPGWCRIMPGLGHLEPPGDQEDRQVWPQVLARHRDVRP